MGVEIMRDEIEIRPLLPNREFSFPVLKVAALRSLEPLLHGRLRGIARGHSLRRHVHEAEHQRVKNAACRIAQQPQNKLLARAQSDEDQRQQPAYRIEEQNIPAPDEKEMDKAEKSEPQQPPDLKAYGCPPCPGPLHEQVKPGSEQQREQPPHLAIDQHQLPHPHPVLRRRMRHGEGIGIEIGGEGLTHRHDIRGQNSHDGNPANEIETRDPLCARGNRSWRGHVTARFGVCQHVLCNPPSGISPR